ncbi:hypothetical protein FF36_04433 [Frankia torreyi]|uniref:Homeodomain-like domain n=1 Tax=Frankia torreyi TaxID=1856 RepID=A0A0D8BB26_9ACTN|nr:hypothetical protein FF36_04433 [Frankia torreyi]KQM03328.1 hypothetical protein FF86_10426 [Frankia sp. CpI1-P]
MASWPRRRSGRPHRHGILREAECPIPAAGSGPDANPKPTVFDVVHDLAENGWSKERIAEVLNITVIRVEALLAVRPAGRG